MKKKRKWMIFIRVWYR